MNIKQFKVLPSKFYKDEEAKDQLWLSVRRSGYSSRELPDQLTTELANISFKCKEISVVLPFWHQVEPDPDCRKLRYYLKSDSTGKRPKHSVRDMDFLFLLCVWRQVTDLDFYQYVYHWVARYESDPYEED